MSTLISPLKSIINAFTALGAVGQLVPLHKGAENIDSSLQRSQKHHFIFIQESRDNRNISRFFDKLRMTFGWSNHLTYGKFEKLKSARWKTACFFRYSVLFKNSVNSSFCLLSKSSRRMVKFSVEEMGAGRVSTACTLSASFTSSTLQGSQYTP